MAYDPIADLERLGVPCGKFEKGVMKMLKTLSRNEAEAFASIWHKANSGGLNAPEHGPNLPEIGQIGWIFGRTGY